MSDFTCTAIFTFKEGKMEEFMKVLKDPEIGIAVTRKWKGYKNIDFYVSKDNPNQLLLWEKWETAQDYDSYLKMRTDTGLFEKLGPLMAEEPKIIKLNPMQV